MEAAAFRATPVGPYNFTYNFMRNEREHQVGLGMFSWASLWNMSWFGYCLSKLLDLGRFLRSTVKYPTC